MQKWLQLTLGGLNGRVGLTVSQTIVSITWDQKPEEDFVIITRSFQVLENVMCLPDGRHL